MKLLLKLRTLKKKTLRTPNRSDWDRPSSLFLSAVQNLLASSTSRRTAKKKKKKAERATAEAAVEDMDDMAATAEQ